jgi:hypothetical protein
MTGENKKRFEEWCSVNYGELFTLTFSGGLTGYPFEMQIGVFIAYYDILGIDIKIHKNYYGYDGRVDEISINDYGYVNSTRKEAQREALKQADSLANKTL